MDLSRLERFEGAAGGERTFSADLNEMAKKAQGASELLKALSHESRLMMLCILADGEKSVSELEQILNERQSTVSQQLARLRFDKLVKTRRDGKTVYYSLASDDVRIILEAVHTVFCTPSCAEPQSSDRS